MKREMISYVMSNIHNCHVQEAAGYQAKKKKPIWVSMGAIAACVAIVAGIGISGRLLHRGVDTPWEQVTILPSAEDVASVFEGQAEDSAGTSSYIQLFYPEGMPLDISAMPEEEHLVLYRVNRPSKALDQAQFTTWSDAVLSRLSVGLGVSESAWERWDYSSDRKLLLAYGDEEISVRFEQMSGEYEGDECLNRIQLTNGANPVYLYDKQISLDTSQSEEEILASLEWVKEALFAAFGHSFDSQDVRFIYSPDSEGQIGSVSVHYYDRSDLLGKQGIVLRFQQPVGAEGQTVWNRCQVIYTQYRMPTEAYYTEQGVATRLSLAEAEEMLHQGYVFGGHSCAACMSLQDRVSFEEYDYVGFEYVAGAEQMIPFYTFYKQIGTTENGNAHYAMTYVCAVAVDGLEEYFAHQEEQHASNGVS